jgi:geranylgeranyl diphosphate synthase, type II
VLDIFRACGVDKWAVDLKERYTQIAFQHMEDIAVMAARKEPLKQLAAFLIKREY